MSTITQIRRRVLGKIFGKGTEESARDRDRAGMARVMENRRSPNQLEGAIASSFVSQTGRYIFTDDMMKRMCIHVEHTLTYMGTCPFIYPHTGVYTDPSVDKENLSSALARSFANICPVNDPDFSCRFPFVSPLFSHNSCRSR